MTKQYTNTREPGEFGDGVTVEKMTDEELVEKLRTVNIATAPYACPEAVDWCHEAADRLSALSPLRGERKGMVHEVAYRHAVARAEAINAELVKALEKLTCLYEQEFDPETLKRPDWLVAALNGGAEK